MSKLWRRGHDLLLEASYPSFADFSLERGELKEKTLLWLPVKSKLLGADGRPRGDRRSASDESPLRSGQPPCNNNIKVFTIVIIIKRS